MATEKFANFAETTLNTSINNSTTTVVVVDGSVFPSSGDFRIVIEDEIMVCTARSTNTLTVTRGAESTTAASHTSGVVVKSPLTAASIKKLVEDNIQNGAASSRPAVSQVGRLYFPDDAPFVLRDNGSSWIPFGPIRQMKNPNDYSSWSYGRNYGGGGTSWTTQEFTQTIRATSVGSGGVGFETVKRAAPSAPFKITACLLGHNTNAQYKQFGIGFRQNSDDKVSFIRYTNDGNKFIRTTANGWDESSENNQDYGNTIPFNPIWFQIEDNNTDHFFRFSVDGINWNLIRQESRTTVFSGSSTHVWWGTQLFGSGEIQGVTLLSWLEE